MGHEQQGSNPLPTFLSRSSNKRIVPLCHDLFYYSSRTTRVSNTSGVIVYNGVCSSVPGKKSVDKAMCAHSLDMVRDAITKLPNHRFGTYYDNQPSIFAVKMVFWLKESNSNESPIFKVAFDVIKSDLPFIILVLLSNSHEGDRKRQRPEQCIQPLWQVPTLPAHSWWRPQMAAFRQQ